MARSSLWIVATVALMLGFQSHSLAELNTEALEKVEQWLAQPETDRPPLASLALPDNLSRRESQVVRDALWKLVVAASDPASTPLGKLPPKLGKLTRGAPVQIRGGELPLGDLTMPFAVLRKESKSPPKSGRALYLCMHGGGQNAQAEGPHAWGVNTREWQAQVQLSLQAYPGEGIYWIPRMADDRKGRWWHKHNQQAFDQVIDHALMHWGVDPNQVYILGISEGGYGTDILAPFMADRFAGAAAMAAGVGLGNPPENLRNLAFRTDVGERDTMFDRQKLAVAFHKRLDELHKEDPQGYQHSINLQKGRGHGIDYRPGPGWMIEHRRPAFPGKVVWIDQALDGQRRERFYWVAFSNRENEGRNRIVAEVDRDQNQVRMVAQQLSGDKASGHPTHIGAVKSGEGTDIPASRLMLLLSDDLVDLDKPVTWELNGTTHTITPNRSSQAILESLLDRPDPQQAAAQLVQL